MNGSIKRSSSPPLSSRAPPVRRVERSSWLWRTASSNTQPGAFSRGNIDLIKAENAHRLTWRSHRHIDIVFTSFLIDPVREPLATEFVQSHEDDEVPGARSAKSNKDD